MADPRLRNYTRVISLLVRQSRVPLSAPSSASSLRCGWHTLNGRLRSFSGWPEQVVAPSLAASLA
jgi:hypothetical protein